MPTILSISEKELKKKNPKVVENPNLDEIRKILKKWPSVKLTKGQYHQLSASLEIDWDHKDPSSWLINFLFVPDMKKHNHDHVLIGHKEAKELHKFLGKFLKAIPKKSNKKKKK